MNADRRALEAVLFDLDGTLLDSTELILASHRHALVEHQRPPVSLAQLLETMGHRLQSTLGGWARDEAQAAAMVVSYREFNAEHHDSMAGAFAGMHAALEDLGAAGLQLGVVTAKRADIAQKGLDLCAYGATWRVLVGGDDVAESKPDPEGLLLACEQLGMQPAAVAYVGDASVDMQASQRAGLYTVAAGWGPQPERLRACQPDLFLESPAGLSALYRTFS